MGGKTEESKQENSKAFNLDEELSSYVDKKVIPSRVADKLKQKINEKNIDINKDQLEKLVSKIHNVLNNYLENKEKTEVDSSVADDDMKLLLEKIEKIQNRLGELENGLFENVENNDESSVVTTEDIKVPGKENKKIEKTLRSNPLEAIPEDPESVIVIMKWLQFLVDKCGRDNLPEVLDYYVDIGWITDDAKINLLDYSNGITEEKKIDEKKTGNVPELPSQDHIQSFMFIQKLKGKDFDKHFIDRVEGEISRLTKKVSNYKFK